MRVVICDDHPVVLMGVKAILAGHGKGSRVVGEANSAQQLLELLAAQPCDLVITDFSMPGKDHQDDGLNMLRRLRVAWPDLPVIVLTMVRNPALLQSMLKLGVQGIVDKAGMVTELLQAIQAVSTGRSYVSARHKAEVGAPLRRADAIAGLPVTALSVREAEIVRLYAQGMSITQIADATNRSVKTISKQKTDAMRKLRLENNHDLLEFARANGLY